MKLSNVFISFMMYLMPLFVYANTVWLNLYQDPTLIVQQGPKNQSGIYLYKVSLTVESNKETFIKKLLDTNQACKWIVDCSNVTLLETVSEIEHIVQTRLNTPWPLKDRLLVTRSIIEHHADQTDISIELHQLQIPNKKDTLLIQHFSARYHLSQIDNQLNIEYWVDSSAGGNIPNWLANQILANNLIKTFKNIQTSLNTPL